MSRSRLPADLFCAEFYRKSDCLKALYAFATQAGFAISVRTQSSGRILVSCCGPLRHNAGSEAESDADDSDDEAGTCPLHFVVIKEQALVPEGGLPGLRVPSMIGTVPCWSIEGPFGRHNHPVCRREMDGGAEADDQSSRKAEEGISSDGDQKKAADERGDQEPTNHHEATRGSYDGNEHSTEAEERYSEESSAGSDSELDDRDDEQSLTGSASDVDTDHGSDAPMAASSHTVASSTSSRNAQSHESNDNDNKDFRSKRPAHSAVRPGEHKNVSIKHKPKRPRSGSLDRTSPAPAVKRPIKLEPEASQIRKRDVERDCRASCSFTAQRTRDAGIEEVLRKALNPTAEERETSIRCIESLYPTREASRDRSEATVGSSTGLTELPARLKPARIIQAVRRKRVEEDE